VSSFADLKAAARQAVHDQFRVPATYTDSSLPAPVQVNVRWHNRLLVQGDLSSGGYAQVIDGVDRIVFSADEIASLGLILRPRGLVQIPDYAVTVALATREPSDGPVNVTWNVDRVS
jgi:hypothetical protein